MVAGLSGSCGQQAQSGRTKHKRPYLHPPRPAPVVALRSRSREEEGTAAGEKGNMAAGASSGAGSKAELWSREGPPRGEVVGEATLWGRRGVVGGGGRYGWGAGVERQCGKTCCDV